MSSVSLDTYPIPNDFPEILHDLIRENLRH